MTATRRSTGSGPSGRSRAPIAPDRVRVSTMRLWGMTVLTGAMVWAALGSLATGNTSRISSSTIAQASGVVAVLAIFGLRSVPVRWIVRGLALASGLLLARFGQLDVTDGLAGSWKVLIWLGALGAALTFAPSSRSVVGMSGPDAMADGDEQAGNEPAGNRDNGDHQDTNRRSGRAMSIASDSRGRIPTAVAIAAISLVAGAALLVGPRVSNWFPTGAKASDIVDRARNRSDNVLVARDSLDMTSRPRLSDKVVMTVRSPIVTFWRAELFDRWDGSSWTRSYQRSGRILVDGKVTPAPDDIAALKGEESTQEFRLETGFATVLPSAASPVSVDSATDLGQRPDGTLTSPYSPLGSGSAYTVRSRQMKVNAEVLRASSPAGLAASTDSVAAAVVAQYGGEPVATDRVVELAKRETAGKTSDFDRIIALERWMSLNTTYSLDAPLSPKGVDVVDHFLFEQTEGWCEQIASSLVVMARSVGIPARLATGYAPGEWDSAGRRFVVREREAHAWAEVWFPGQGWVPFDPTASVPLSGTADARSGATARDWREILGMVLLAVGMVSLGAAPLARAMERLFARLRRRHAKKKAASERWEVRAAQRLEHIGAEAGRPREPSDSLTRFGGAVARVADDDRLSEVGQILDRFTYGPPGGERAEAASPADLAVDAAGVAQAASVADPAAAADADAAADPAAADRVADRGQKRVEELLSDR